MPPIRLTPTLAQHDAPSFSGQDAAPAAAGEAAPAVEGQDGGPQDANPGPPPGGGIGPMLLFAIMMAVLLFVLMGGNRKEKKKRAKLLESLKKGDKVQTIGGILGTVIEMRDSEVVLKVDENANTRIKFNRSAIQSLATES